MKMFKGKWGRWTKIKRKSYTKYPKLIVCHLRDFLLKTSASIADEQTEVLAQNQTEMATHIFTKLYPLN